MAAFQSSYENDNANSYMEACNQASARSMTKEYQGCAVHVCAVVEMVRGAPLITRYKLSDWCDDSTVCTYVNGHAR